MLAHLKNTEHQYIIDALASSSHSDYNTTYWNITRSTEISRDLLRSHEIYWDLTRSTEISQDLLRSHKIYWDLTRFTEIYWDLTRFTEISQDLLRSHKIYWYDLTWHQHLTFDIWHLTFDIWNLTFDIWHLTFDIWQLTIDNWHLTFDIWHLTWLTDSFYSWYLVLKKICKRFEIYTFEKHLKSGET